AGKKIGVTEELDGSNHLQIEGRKSSGNAQLSTKGRMFSHGTLMHDSELEHIVSALNVKKEKIESKGIKSIRSRVTNISEYLDEPITMDAFKEIILKYILDVKNVSDVPTFELTQTDRFNIYEITKNRYQKWEWNYEKSPAYNKHTTHKIPSELLDVRIDVEKGNIKSCKTYNDSY